MWVAVTTDTFVTIVNPEGAGDNVTTKLSHVPICVGMCEGCAREAGMYARRYQSPSQRVDRTARLVSQKVAVQVHGVWRSWKRASLGAALAKWFRETEQAKAGVHRKPRKDKGVKKGKRK